MSRTGYKKPFKINKIVIDFFLGSGLSACWDFARGNDNDLFLLAIRAILFGIAAMVLIEGGKYLYNRIKKGRKKNKSRRKKQID